MTETNETTFELLPHVCRRCLGRIIRRNDGACRCADCGAMSNIAEAICGCGWKLPSPTPAEHRRGSPASRTRPAARRRPTLFVIAMIAAADQHIATRATPSAWQPARAAA